MALLLARGSRHPRRPHRAASSPRSGGDGAVSFGRWPIAPRPFKALLALALWCAAGAHGQGPTAGDPTGDAPFHDFRGQTLEYAGPRGASGVAEELTRVAIGWFGPADAAHPIHGDLWTAALLAIEDANRTGGWNGLPFELLPRWSADVWGSGVSQIARLAYKEGAWAILGSVDGASTHLAEQVVAKARLPLVSPVSTDESVNLAGVPWMFSLAPADHQWASALAASLIETVGPGSFSLVALTDHDSRLATEALLDELARFDRVPAMRLDLPPGASDLAERLARLALAEQAALLLVAGPEDGARLLLALRTSGFEGAIFGSPGFARRHCLETAGAAADGLRVPLLGGPVSNAEEEQRFRRLFRQRTGFDADWAARHTYDATGLLVQAIRSAGLSRAAIREALVELSPWQGLTGPVVWERTGQNRRTVGAVARIHDGRVVVD